MSKLIKADAEYKEWLAELKKRIRNSQIKAAVHVNSELMELYWNIGADIVSKQLESKWGDGIIPQLSKDLKEEFPDATGYSERNLKYMRHFYQFYSTAAFRQQTVAQIPNGSRTPIGQQLVAQSGGDSTVSDNLALPTSCTLIPWGHNIQIFTKAKSYEEALFYVQQTIENGWSRAVLMNFMSANLYKPRGMPQTISPPSFLIRRVTLHRKSSKIRIILISSL
jgi:predicted nuclease of restriction endonuclease-like (RecB) superfamily